VSETALGFLLAGTLVGAGVPALLCRDFSGEAAARQAGGALTTSRIAGSSVNFT